MLNKNSIFNRGKANIENFFNKKFYLAHLTIEAILDFHLMKASGHNGYRKGSHSKIVSIHW